MSSKQLIIVLAIVLVAFSSLGLYVLPHQETRLIKLISTIVILDAFILLEAYKKRNISLVFVCFLLSDIFMLEYEDVFYKNVTLFCLMGAFFSIILHLIPKIDFLKLNKYVTIIFVFLIIINVYMMVEIFNLLGVEIVNISQKIISYMLGIIVMIAGFLGGGYNLKFNSVESTYCAFFISSFVLTIIFTVIAYYSEFHFLFHFSRSFYLIGLSIMTLYSVLPPEKKEIL